MKTKSVFFFSDIEDMAPLVKEIELTQNVHYILTGLFDNAHPIYYTSILQSPGFGYVSSGDWNQNASYLVIPAGMNVNVRSVPQRNGGTKFAIDQMGNADSCVLKLSGIYSDNVIVAGSLGTISSSDYSAGFMKVFTKLLKKNFEKIGDFYVGKSARNKLVSGWRLVTNIKSPIEYDLKA